MNQNQHQLYQPSESTRSRQPTLLATATGHPNHPNARVHQIHSINPLLTLRNSFEAHTQPYLYSSHPFPIYVPLDSPDLSSFSATPSYTTATPPQIFSVRTLSTRRSSLRPPSTQPSSTQASSAPIPHDKIRSIPHKRARKHAPSPPTLYPASSVPSSNLSLNHPPHLPLHSPQLPLIEASLERPSKRPRLDMGCSSTATDRRGSEPQAFSQPFPRSRPNPKPKSPLLHPLVVDYSRPIKPVVPRSSLRPLNLQGSGIQLSPFPENPDPKRSLDDELKGPVDPSIEKELAELMRKQQKRVQSELGGPADPFLVPTPISSLDSWPSSSRTGVAPPRSRPEAIALYGPPPRTNEYARLGQSLTNPSIIILDDDDDDGFEGVLDLYCGAVQGSGLSMELEFAVGGDVGLIGVGWEDVGSLQVSVMRGSSAPSSSEDLQESRIRTLAAYKRVVEAEKALLPSRSATPKEEPPLGIEWSYNYCGYATGKVVNVRSANNATTNDTYANKGKKR